MPNDKHAKTGLTTFFTRFIPSCTAAICEKTPTKKGRVSWEELRRPKPGGASESQTFWWVSLNWNLRRTNERTKRNERTLSFCMSFLKHSRLFNTLLSFLAVRSRHVASRTCGKEAWHMDFIDSKFTRSIWLENYGFNVEDDWRNTS